MAEDLTLPVWLGPLLYGLACGSLLVGYQALRRVAKGEEAVRYEPRRPVPWQSEGTLLVLFILVGASLALLSELSNRGEGLSLDEPTWEVTLVGALQHALVCGLLSAGMVVWLSRQAAAGWRDFGAPDSWREALRDMRLGLFTFVAAVGPVYAVQALLVLGLGAPSEHPAIRELLNDPSGERIVAVVLMAVVVAPLFEEFAFRVLLQGWLERLAGTQRVWPIVASSLLFALSHQGQGYAPVALFVLALFLGYAYRQTHRLMPCVVAHLLFNALSLLVASSMATE